MGSDRPRLGEFIFVIWGSWGVRCGSPSSFHKFSPFCISGPRVVALNARLCGGCFVNPLRNLKIPPFTRFARPTAYLVPRSYGPSAKTEESLDPWYGPKSSKNQLIFAPLPYTSTNMYETWYVGTYGCPLTPCKKKNSGSNLTLTFGPLRGPLGAQKGRF